MATADSIAPPPGFIEDSVAPPEGFVEDVPPPEGFVLDDEAPAPTQPQSSAPVDFVKRLAAGTTQAAMQIGRGLMYVDERIDPTGTGTLLKAVFGPADPKDLMRKEVVRFAADVQEGAPAELGVDPAREGTIPSKLAGAAGSVIPIVASGPLAPLTASALMGESQREEAEAAGAGEGKQAAAFGGGAALGAISELTMGIPALLRSAKAVATTGKGAVREVVEQVGKSAVRESAQEATEQLGSNVIAKTLYDPERGVLEGVGEAAVLGAAIGGPLGGVVQTAATVDAKRTGELQAGIEQDIAALGLEETAPSVEPTTETTTPPSTPEPTALPAPAAETSSQSTEGEASVEPHLRTSTAVKAILDEQQSAVTQPAMKEPSVPPEGGALLSAGARTPKVAPIGVTPRGDKNWLKIPAWFKRAGKGLFTEGTRGVLGRTNNQVGKALAKATRQHVDIEQELYGQHEKILRDATKSLPPKRLDAAMAEVERYNRDVENGRTPAPLAPDAKKILDAWYEVGKRTGDIARANNVQVWDAKLGAHRPMGTVKNYIPRMFSAEVEAALRNPDDKANAPLFNSLAQAIATHKGITIDAAAAELNTVASRFTANDFHGNLEMARNEQLPEIFYEYKLENLAARYLPAYSERMAQIIAYGQRLGPREAPLRKNLWDVARQESRDTETQQWLNEAEDQATGFKPKTVGGKLARRAQALGNAALLSDPTTTVVRNMLSGLSVTTERFGIGRSLQQLAAAGKAVSQMDAKELGAVRDDIGQFLNAEQLGDSKADEFIRWVQQQALAKSGFSGSETFVRTHNVLVASTFVRDAAASLATKPSSRLSREALAQFKRWDVDPEKIVAEKGDWKTGPETRKFIRTAVRESQGGYRFDQVPLWGGTAVGRFTMQYARWGMQRAKDIFQNTIAPAIGEKVEFRGKQMTHRNVLPLMRLGLFTAGLGEVFAGIASLLFDRDRRDSTFSEIGEAWEDDELKAVKMLGERIVNDIIMAGTLGMISQPLDFIKSVKDQSRLKNPTEPPSLFGVKALTTLAQRAQDQGGTLTKRDWLEFAVQTARGPVNVSKVVRNVADDPAYQARNDVSTLRAAAQRWAKDTGQDVALRKSRGDFGKSPNAPFFEPIEDALLVGDSAKAKQLSADFVKNHPDKNKARTALKTSVKGRQPFRAGTMTSQENLGRFMAWAEKNLPEDDLLQVKRVQGRYEKAARTAGLW